jgi:Rha family phage regulatory protein
MSEPDLLDKRQYPVVPKDAIQLVSRNDQGKDVTTSLIIAEVFGKRHKHVLDSIVELSCSEEFRKPNFRLSSYKSVQGKTMPMFEITKDGFSFLVMGYTGKKASRFKEMFIKEFNKREAMLKSDDYILNRAMGILSDRVRALESTVGKSKTIIAEQKYVISEQRPKAVYHDEVLQSKSGYTTTTIAKELGMSAVKLNRILNSKKIIYKRDKHWVPFALYQNRDYMLTRTTTFEKDDDTYTSIDSRWTEKGRRFIHMVINKELRKKTNS